jgi:AAA+ ATPase superfamily predicted ATPase
LYTTFSGAIDFNPNNSLLYEMVNSGNLKNISNAELRRQLTNWISRMEDISRQEAELGVQREKVLDMFKNDAHSLGTIFKHAGVYNELGLPKTENETSNLRLLQSTAFENNILMFIITSYATEKAHYDPLMKHLNDILSLLEKEIEC